MRPFPVFMGGWEIALRPFPVFMGSIETFPVFMGGGR